MTFHKLILNTLFCSLMITEYLKLQTTPVIYIHTRQHSDTVSSQQRGPGGPEFDSITWPGQKTVGGKLVG